MAEVGGSRHGRGPTRRLVRVAATAAAVSGALVLGSAPAPARAAAIPVAGALDFAAATGAAAAPPARVATRTLPPYDPNRPECRRGDIRCVNAVITEMDRRFQGLARRCDHNALFSLLYLRTTEAYRRAVQTPGFFADPSFMNYYDVVFADLYFAADTNWRAGRHAAVPEAWRIAFGAADRKQVTGGANILLGMNAHIQRDLAFTLEKILLPELNYARRKADHDKVNAFLEQVGEREMAEAARRFDPTVDDEVVLKGFKQSVFFQAVVTWREEAWRNAERLLSARHNPAERARVAASIEAAAAAQARVIVTSNSYSSDAPRQARDSYCATHWRG